MKKFLIALFLLSPLPAQAQDLTPDQIVQKVDDVRSPDTDYSVVAAVASYKPNRPVRNATYEVLVKGREKTIIKMLQPQMERGRSLLMRGQDFWAFYPEVEKPLRISFQERLVGDVANGDIARTNFSGDYQAQFLRNENIGGKEYYVLQLNAAKKEAAYGKIFLWVEQELYWPLKAEFYAISGRFLKTCSYEDYRMLGGSLRPSRLVLTDAVAKGQYSVITYDDMKNVDLPEKYFIKEYLKKMVY